MVVVPDSTPVSLCDSGRADKANWRLGVATDLLVWTYSDFEDRLQLKASLPSTIGREGRLLLCGLTLGAVPTRSLGSEKAHKDLRCAQIDLAPDPLASEGRLSEAFVCRILMTGTSDSVITLDLTCSAATTGSQSSFSRWPT